MAKEITCEILADYFSIDDSDDWCTKICEVKWNGRTPKGYDIRKYNKEEDKLMKGICVSYDGFRSLVYNAIEHGLVDPDEVQNRINKRKDQVLDMNDFKNIFASMNEEMNKYKRDKYGLLKDDHGHYVITKRRTKNV